MAAEQVVQRAPLAQAGHHAVHAALEQADLAAVVDRELDVEIVGFNAQERAAYLVEGIGQRASGDADDECADDDPQPDEEPHRASSVRVLGGTAPHEHEADHEQRDGTAEGPRQQQPGPHAERQAA